MSQTTLGPAVVSGAGSGIGRAIALALARRGHPVVLLGRRPEPLAATLEEAGGDGLVLTCDVRQADSVAAATAQVHRRWPAAEILVPAAGVGVISPLEETSVEDFNRVLATNLVGVFHLLRSFLPAMRRRGKGWIFPLISVAGRQGFAGWSAYCASKWGVAGLVQTLRLELAGSGVRITSLYPGATASPFWDPLPGEWDRKAMLDASEVSRALVAALDAGPSAVVEEIHLGPAGGAL